MAIQEWKLSGFLDEVSKIHTTMPDRSFVFILGAGASFSSHIPTAKELAQRWLTELHKRECMDESSLNDWIASGFLEMDGLTYENAATYYPNIFDRRFQGDPEAGYAELENEMEGKVPSLGYTLLAEILERTRHKVVITTNFDNLVADALAMQSYQSPLIVGHETLTSFVRANLRRPLIAKIHRDIFLAPINDAQGVGELGEGWRNALRKLFGHYTPIVVGYAGNDGSLMGFLKELNQGDISGHIYWCHREGSSLSADAEEVLKKHAGVKVRITGFDEFAMELAAKIISNFDLSEVAARIERTGKERAETYREQAQKLKVRLTNGSVEQQNTGALFTQALQGGTTWWSWQMRADAEPDLQNRKIILEEGLRLFPNNATLFGNYALFLINDLKDANAAKEAFEKAITIEPYNQINLVNYALLLTNEIHDFDAAEKIYNQLIKTEPLSAIITSNYANFLMHTRRNHEKAELMFKKTIELDPNYPLGLIGYANLMYMIYNANDMAQALYEKAIKLDPSEAHIAGNYASFLYTQYRFDEAEILHKKAIELDPNDIDFYVNFAASLLARGGKKDLPHVKSLCEKCIHLSQGKCSPALAEAFLYLIFYAELSGKPVQKHLEGLKKVLQSDFERGLWNFGPIFKSVLPQIKADMVDLYETLGAAILDKNKMADLNKYDTWRNLK